MALEYPGQYNSWVPSWEATGQVIAFMRDPKRFPINRYVAFRPAGKRVGLYLNFDPDNPARSLSLDQMVWAEGSERPTGEGNVSGFEYLTYKTIRRDLAVTLGNGIIKQTDWPILALNSQTVVNQAMTALTRLTWNTLDTVGNWGAYTASATTAGMGAGKIELANVDRPADANYLNIKKAFDYAVMQIIINTNQMVRPDQIVCVIGLNLAKLMAESAEIVDYLKQSPFAWNQVYGANPGRNARFNLPDQLYGVELVVEDTYYVSSLKGATVTRAKVKSDDNLVFISKVDALPGDNVGDVPTPNFSTFQIFAYNESLNEQPQETRDNANGLVTVEYWPDVRNKRTEVHVTFDTDQKLVAPASGFFISDVTTSLT